MDSSSCYWRPSLKNKATNKVALLNYRGTDKLQLVMGLDFTDLTNFKRSIFEFRERTHASIFLSSDDSLVASTSPAAHASSSC